MTTYDPADEPNRDVDMEVTLAKAALRKELGLVSGMTGLGSSPSARLGEKAGESLRRQSAAEAATDAEVVAEARREADPDGLLTDRDVADVLHREGIDPNRVLD